MSLHAMYHVFHSFIIRNKHENEIEQILLHKCWVFWNSRPIYIQHVMLILEMVENTECISRIVSVIRRQGKTEL